ncbi:MAG: septum formation initiator family protein [Parvularculaceae bacterium]
MNRRSINWLFDILLPGVFVCLTAYLAYDGLIGASGYRALAALQDEVAIKQAEVDALTQKREHLERTAEQLNPRSLDADMVDEKVRSVLGYVEAGDIVIPRDQLEAIIRDAKAKTR